jgi:hypothetical protein
VIVPWIKTRATTRSSSPKRPRHLPVPEIYSRHALPGARQRDHHATGNFPPDQYGHARLPLAAHF